VPGRRVLVQAQILTAAADLFHARGYRAATLDELARTLRMSKATLYGYFRSKEEILAAIFHRTMSLFEEGIRAIRRGAAAPDEQVRRVIRHHVRAVVAERSFLSVFFSEEANLPPHLARRITARKARYDRTVLGIVQAGRRAGVIATAQPRLLVFALLGMSNWVYRWYNPRGAWDADAIADGLIALAERGYAGAHRLDDTTARLARLSREVHALRALLGPQRRRRS
jgi:TetR/AcrR family transcriptional regulator, cholesterol catabolism regulator